MRYTIYDLRFTIGAPVCDPAGTQKQPTTNNQHRTSSGRRRHSGQLDVGCWMLDVGCSPRIALCLLAAVMLGCSAGRAETLLLTNATIHTVSGATIARGDVLIQDGKIKGVFAASQPSRPIYPSAATKIDLKGLHL